ncbi:MAG TPA: hypothetical protein VK177_20505 [Flavobacteriales bacterium]|nr:hypothetical protein [Flavobacteriales bacterium]
MQKINWRRAEVLVFYLLIYLNLIPVLKTGLVFSLDGPAHTYNALMLKQFISGDTQLLKQYFELNTTIIPNWTGHGIMTFFQYFVSPRMSEKLLLIGILVFTPISFRYLVKSFKHVHVIGSYFIFILTYNVFQVLGFYNFLIAFIPAFFLFGYFVRHLGVFSRKQYMVLASLLVLIYLSHVFVYILCMLTLFLFYAIHIGLKEGLKPGVYLAGFFKNSIWLIVSALPSLVLFLLFYITKPELHPVFLDKAEITNMLRNNQSFVLFTSAELDHTRPLLYLMMITAGAACIKRVAGFIKNRTLILADVFPVLLAIMLVLLYILPDGDGWGGFYTLRTLLLVNVFMLLWAATVNLSAWFKFGAFYAMAYYHMLLMVNYHTQSEGNQPRLQACHKAATHIEQGKLVLPVNATGNWMYGHTALRAATVPNTIALENYEATMNYFPFKWKETVKAKPELPTGTIPGDFAWWKWKTPGKRVLVDYIFSVGNVFGQEGKHFRVLGDCINKHYTEIYRESDCYLYKLNKE